MSVGIATPIHEVGEIALTQLAAILLQVIAQLLRRLIQFPRISDPSVILALIAVMGIRTLGLPLEGDIFSASVPAAARQ